jgi:alpha-N-arabinofuranosidase
MICKYWPAASFGPATAGSVKVDFRSPIRTIPLNAVGLNTNYMLDGPVRRNAGPGLANTLKDIGMRSLRYPGGEKADGMFWNGRPGGFSPDPQVRLRERDRESGRARQTANWEGCVAGVHSFWGVFGCIF